MSGAITALRKIQLGRETTPGTAVVATSIWRGLGVLQDTSEHIVPDENIGISRVDRSYVPKVGGKINLAPVPATFEQLMHLAEMNIKALGTPAADGAGSGKIYTYPLWITTPVAVKTYTIEGGNNLIKQEMAYCHGTLLTLEGQKGKSWMMSSDISGRQVTPSTTLTAATIAFVASTKKITDSASGLAVFTTGMTIKVTGSVSNDGVYTVATGGVAGEIVVTEALTDEAAGASVMLDDWFTPSIALITPEECLFGKTKLYLDAIGGTIGSTQKSNTLLQASVKIKGGARGQDTGSGEIYFSHLEYDPPEMDIEITFIFEGTAKAEMAYWQAKTPRLLQLKCLGSALASAGTTYTYKTMIIQGAGRWIKFEAIGNEEGNDIVKATFRCAYNSTAALFGSVIVVNEVAAVP